MSPRRTFGRSEWILAIVLSVLFVLAVLVMTNESVARWNAQVYATWTDWAVRYGFWGALATAFLGNLTIVVIFPYTVLVFFLASTGIDPWLLGVATGIGAELGELSGFLLGRLGSSRLRRRHPHEYQALQTLVTQRPRLIPLLLFFFSLSPLPDDLLFIPLGILRYPAWKLILPSALGKIGAGLIIALTGNSLVRVLATENVTHSILSQIGTLAVLSIALYLVSKISWQQWFARLVLTNQKRTLSK